MKSEQSFTALFMAHRATLLDYAARVVGDRTLAEDIVQDAWLSLARQPDLEVREPLAYLRTMVRNLSIDALRRTFREARASGGDMENAIDTVADTQASPEAISSARRDLDCVMRVLRGLPERQRIAIEMVRFGDFKLREVAQRFGVSISLVHLLMSKGLATCAEKCGLEGMCEK